MRTCGVPNIFSRSGEDPPHFLKQRSSNVYIITTIWLGVFTDVFLYGLMVPVLPFALPDRVGVPQHDVQYWVSILLAVYGAAVLVASPICGYFADHSSSRQMPLLLGLLALGGATAMLCVGSSIGVLVAGRLLQGASTAVIWSVGLALLADTVGPSGIGEAMGYISMAMSLGVLTAPLLGGVLYEARGYYSVFYLAFALIGLDILARVTLIEKKSASRWTVDQPAAEIGEAGNITREDQQEPDLRTAGDAALPSAPSSEANPPGWRSEMIRRPPPIVRLLGSLRVWASLWGITVQAALMTAFDSVLPIFVQKTFHWSSTGGGLIFLALMIPSFGAPIVGRLTDKYGSRWIVATGFILDLPFWVLLRLVTHDSLDQKVLLCALIVLIGVCLNLAIPGLMGELTHIVEAKARETPGTYGAAGAYGQAYALLNCAFAAGTLIGPIWAGLVETSAGWGTMSWTLGLLSAVTAVPTLLWTGRRLRL